MRHRFILGGSDCGEHFMKFYWKDVKTYTVEDLWRIFSKCGGSDVNVAGLPRQNAYGDPSCMLKKYGLKCVRPCNQC